MPSRRALLAGVASMTMAMSTRAASASAANAELIRRYFDVWNTGALDELDRLLAPDYLNHTPSTPNPPRGPAGLKPIIAAFRSGFPDLHFDIEDVIATDAYAVARVVMTGTHRGTLFDLPPTGRKVRVNQINIERIVAGRIAEHWRVTDELALMRQLGVHPRSDGNAVTR